MSCARSPRPRNGLPVITRPRLLIGKRTSQTQPNLATIEDDNLRTCDSVARWSGSKSTLATRSKRDE